ncbi:MAG: TatD family hydrolase, partial [Oscillospiraceae bacterium]
MIFDSHAHYDDEQFDIDRDLLLGSSLPQKAVVGIINVCSSMESIPKTLALISRYDYLYGGVGIHPECAGHLPSDYLQVIEQAAVNKKVVAIGEIGLDYHYEDACPKAIQKAVFLAQLTLAKRLNLPVILHDREAHGDTMDILRETKPKGVVHCFSGSREMAREIIKLGMYIGLGGVVTFKNARNSLEVVGEIPLDRLLLETDCPYLAPVPYRGKRNDSSLIPYAAAKIAEVRGISAVEVLHA